MGSALKVIGLGVLLAVGFVVARLLFRIAVLIFKTFMVLFAVKKLVESVGQGPPATIRLVGVSGARWDDDRARRLAEPLPGLGYREIGFFDVTPLEGWRIQAWVHGERGTNAVVYQQPELGVWADVLTRFEDGTSLTYTDSPRAGKLRQRPGYENVSFPGQGTAELDAKMLADRPPRPTRRLTPADFPGDFERAYADEMRWRQGPENFDPGSVGTAQMLGGMISGRFDPDQLRQLRESFDARRHGVLADLLREQYRGESGMTDAEWAAVGPGLLAVYPTMDAESLQRDAAAWHGHPEADALREALEAGQNPRDAFDAVNLAAPEVRRFRRLGDVPMGETSPEDDDDDDDDGRDGGPDAAPAEHRADLYAPPGRPAHAAGVADL